MSLELTNELKQEGLEPLDRTVERTQEERDAMPLAPELNLTQLNEMDALNDDRLEEINQELQVGNDDRQIERDRDSAEVANIDRALSDELTQERNELQDELSQSSEQQLVNLEAHTELESNLSIDQRQDEMDANKLSMDPEFLLAGDGIAPAQELSQDEVDRINTAFNQLSSTEQEKGFLDKVKEGIDIGLQKYIDGVHTVNQEGAHVLTSIAALATKYPYHWGLQLTGTEKEDAQQMANDLQQRMTMPIDELAKNYEHRTIALGAGYVATGGVGLARAGMFSGFAKASTTVTTAGATIGAGANIAGQYLGNPEKDINWESVAVSGVTGALAPHYGLKGVLGVTSLGVIADERGQNKDFEEISSSLMINAVFTAGGYQASSIVQNVSRPYLSNHHWNNELARLEWADTSRGLFKYVMKPFNNSTSAITGDITGSAITEWLKNDKE